MVQLKAVVDFDWLCFHFSFQFQMVQLKDSVSFSLSLVESLFQFQMVQLKLYDVENDRAYKVIVTDKNFVEKNYKN